MLTEIHGLQMEELEHGQILERGTVSLPTMQNFRQELLKGAPWPPTDGGRPPAQGGDLANWRRPGTVSSEDAPVSSSVLSDQACLPLTSKQDPVCGAAEMCKVYLRIWG